MTNSPSHSTPSALSEPFTLINAVDYHPWKKTIAAALEGLQNQSSWSLWGNNNPPVEMVGNGLDLVRVYAIYGAENPLYQLLLKQCTTTPSDILDTLVFHQQSLNYILFLKEKGDAIPYNKEETGLSQGDRMVINTEMYGPLYSGNENHNPVWKNFFKSADFLPLLETLIKTGAKVTPETILRATYLLDIDADILPALKLLFKYLPEGHLPSTLFEEKSYVDADYSKQAKLIEAKKLEINKVKELHTPSPEEIANWVERVKSSNIKAVFDGGAGDELTKTQAIAQAFDAELLDMFKAKGGVFSFTLEKALMEAHPEFNIEGYTLPPAGKEHYALEFLQKMVVNHKAELLKPALKDFLPVMPKLLRDLENKYHNDPQVKAAYKGLEEKLFLKIAQSHGFTLPEMVNSPDSMIKWGEEEYKNNKAHYAAPPEINFTEVKSYIAQYTIPSQPSYSECKAAVETAAETAVKIVFKILQEHDKLKNQEIMRVEKVNTELREKIAHYDDMSKVIVHEMGPQKYCMQQKAVIEVFAPEILQDLGTAFQENNYTGYTCFYPDQDLPVVDPCVSAEGVSCFS